MRLVSYNVSCNTTKMKESIKKDKMYLEKKLSEIILKRREKGCYENSSTNKKHM